MLVLTRKSGEELVINDNIRVKVVAVHGRRVRLGITAPDEVPVQRLELFHALSPAENGSTSARAESETTTVPARERTRKAVGASRDG